MNLCEEGSHEEDPERHHAQGSHWGELDHDEEEVRSSLIAELQNYAMENSVDVVSQNIVDFESKETKLRQILIDVKSRVDRSPSPSGKGTVKIFDISEQSDEGSSCDATIEDESENSSNLQISNVCVPRNKRIEVEILRIENPSEIYVRKADSDYDHTRLREDLGIFYSRKAASAKNKRSHVTAGMWTEGRLCVVRTEEVRSCSQGGGVGLAPRDRLYVEGDRRTL